MKPDINTIPAFYQNYVKLVTEDKVLDALKNSSKELMTFLDRLTEEQGSYAYAEGKWSIKVLLMHMMDAERIFAYRALRFSRNDRSSLPGFDEQAYAYQANAEEQTLAGLIQMMQHLRQTTIDLYQTFTEEMLLRTGFANNYEVSVNALGFIIAGHERHHLGIIKSRYFPS
ncbi:MAG TPA: DinB family protein [Cyclobacteriaceae bacterium]|nr:DinB family protein [Cyclobacteriaceae bacterium]